MEEEHSCSECGDECGCGNTEETCSMCFDCQEEEDICGECGNKTIDCECCSECFLHWCECSGEENEEED